VVGHHHHFVFSQKLLDVQGHSATFLDDFTAGCRAVCSHSSKTSDSLFVLEKQTPCALSHQQKKTKQNKKQQQQHCCETGANLPHSFWCG